MAAEAARYEDARFDSEKAWISVFIDCGEWAPRSSQVLSSYLFHSDAVNKRTGSLG